MSYHIFYAFVDQCLQVISSISCGLYHLCKFIAIVTSSLNSMMSDKTLRTIPKRRSKNSCASGGLQRPPNAKACDLTPATALERCEKLCVALSYNKGRS